MIGGAPIAVSPIAVTLDVETRPSVLISMAGDFAFPRRKFPRVPKGPSISERVKLEQEIAIALLKMFQN